ncbi:MAG: hypothetical protein NVS1B4_23820 [Gemmatimonadaceae bacterium]
MFAGDAWGRGERLDEHSCEQPETEAMIEDARPTPTARGHATYTPFDSVLYESVRGRPERARDTLGALVDDLLRRGDPSDLQYHIFAAALTKRFEGARETDINLYLRQFDQSQISLFNLVAQHLPTVSLAGRIANEVLCQAIARHPVVKLLDIGIGTGRQEVALLRALAARGTLPERLTIVAVEPDANSLSVAEGALMAVADEIGLDLTFVPMQGVIEELPAEGWRVIRNLPGALIAHGAFALHHIRLRPGTTDPRDELFERLRESDALDVVLCEPNAEHHTPIFYERVANCWRHFEQTFDLIERLDVDVPDRRAMKMFFAREIEDILGNSEENRCERHEGVASWIDRLRRAGFTATDHLELSDTFRDLAVSVTPHDGYVGIDYQDETLVAVVCASRGARPSDEDRPVVRDVVDDRQPSPAA